MIYAVIKLMRLYYSAPLAGGLWVIAYFLSAGDLQGLYGRLTLAFAALWCVIAAGYIFNDVFDVEADKVNAPARPLAAGRIKRKSAVMLGGCLNAAGLILSFACPAGFTVGIAALIAGLFVYNIFSKRMGIFKNILVAVLVVSLYPLAFAVSQPPPSPRLNILYVHPLWLFMTTIAYQMIKDTLDIQGDNLLSKTTLEYRRSLWFKLISRGLLLTGGLLTLVPYFYGWCGGIYLTAATAALTLSIAATFAKPKLAICYIYAEVVLITLGSLLDLLVLTNI